MKSILLVLAICLLSSGWCEADSVVSARELKDFMDTHYPRTSVGPMEVVLFAPSVEMTSKNSVRLTFEASASPRSRNHHYRNILAAVEGELVVAEGHLILREVTDLKMDASAVPFEYRPVVERAIHNMVINDYIVSPILKIRNDQNDVRRFLYIDKAPIRVIGGTEL